jgi:protocatechuate 3,4-dioxygenase beta subunit
MTTARLSIGVLAMFGIAFVIAWSILAQPWEPPSVGVPEGAIVEEIAYGDTHDQPDALAAKQSVAPRVEAASPEDAPTQVAASEDAANTASAEKPGHSVKGAAASVSHELLRLSLAQRWMADTNKLNGNTATVILKAPPNSPRSPGLQQPLKIKSITGTVTGQVLDPWGAPIKGASVSTVPSGGASFTIRYVIHNDQVVARSGNLTDENGMFTLKVNEMTLGDSDLVTIYAQASGYSASEHLKLSVKADQVSSGHILRLRQASSLEGYVVDSNGTGVSGVTVLLTSQGAPPKTQTDASGRFQFSEIPANFYVINITAPGVKQRGEPVGITVEPGAAARLAQSIEVDLVPCVTGRLLDLHGKAPARAAVIRYVDEKGKNRSRTVKVASDGAFSIELGAGRYDLDIDVKGHETARVVAYVVDGPYDLGIVTLPATP